VSCPVKEQKPPPDLKRPWNAIALRASLVEVRLRDLQHTARPCENVRLWHLRPLRFVECQLRARSKPNNGEVCVHSEADITARSAMSERAHSGKEAAEVRSSDQRAEWTQYGCGQ
jgi:hypothetical protein